MTIKHKLERYLAETAAGEIPGPFIDFWTENYGKNIHKTIRDADDNEWVLQRMLTVNDEKEIETGTISWRNNTVPEELDYSVPYLESVLPNWEENDRLIPFAALNTDNAAFDLAVLNFSESSIPKISIWLHEESLREAFLTDIANTAEDFLGYIR